MKNSKKRRDELLKIIKISKIPVTASYLANKLCVSRQVIVGDIALIRASGQDVIATSRGYIIQSYNHNSYFKIACIHTKEQTKDELYTIVDAGATVLNVIVEHNIYGEITGNLNISSRDEVDLFFSKIEKENIKLLSELTSGIHLHTLLCQNNRHFEIVKEALKEKGYILNDV
ncbi:MAG: transcription repressor NadR [Defluviitaleaceae bacterium]|nr:transcription repressor NadR [Defluviitaleaceae bacterium]